MNQGPPPTPDWFGKPEPPESRTSLGAVIIAVIATFGVTVVLCGGVGLALFGLLEEKNEAAMAACLARSAVIEQVAAERQEEAARECQKKLALAARKCAESRERMDDPELRSPLTRKSISAVIQETRPDFRKCFNEVLRTEPTGQGKVVLQLTIARSGRVASTKVTGDALAGKLRACLQDKAKALRFPPGDGTKTVRVPLVFVAQ